MNVTLAEVQALTNDDPQAHIPEYLLMMAAQLWPKRELQFLRTNCHATCARLRHLLWPDDSRWIIMEEVPATSDVYMVSFDDEHELMVVKDRVLQSYAFKSEVEERPYDPSMPYYKHVSYDSDDYQHIQPTFYVPQ